MNWQPIETAPKDGSYILLVEKYETIPFIGYWDELLEKWEVSTYNIYSDFQGGIETECGEISQWCPIPKFNT